MRLASPAVPAAITGPPADFQAAANVLRSVNTTLGTASRAIGAGTDTADPVVLDAFDDAYVQAHTAAGLLDISADERGPQFADAIRQSVLGTIMVAKAAASDTVVDVPQVLGIIRTARNEALAIAQELGA